MKTRILKLLEENCRYSPQDLAVMLDSTVEVIEKLTAELEEDKIICGYKMLINWDKVSEIDNVTALIEVKVAPSRGEGFDKIAKRIYMFKEVEALYLMSGGFDLTVIVKGKSLKEVAMFVSKKLSALDEVLSTGTHFVLKRYKDHGVIFEQHKKDERMVVSP
ncbi:Lrp/AsnC family transcriptional regulator [Candidatus Epulonipiscium viviparus]|uniref:Lrp/AsnC family transcriptional regulator n=1 Tax=Candidatus Epulonipiscium viviparus TaxID=420336 RepID=UPI00016BFC71|nr:Lrp/AsnC family transcriptional regulator [Candidatus Epulopiscium viviparus]